MATSFGFAQFSRRMDFRSDEIGRGVNTLVRKIALVADQGLVFATPVDKGVARSNWRVSLGAALEDTVDAFAPGENLGSGELANASGAIQQGLGVIARRLPGQPVFISNNIPYIESLDNGSSAQAPAGFVEGAVVRAASVVGVSKIMPSP